MKSEQKRLVIYLSGPIMDEHEGAARAWREEAKRLLSPEFRLLDPMRRKFIDRQVDSANEIVEFDLQDVRDADIILVNYKCFMRRMTSENLSYPSLRFRLKNAVRGWSASPQKFSILWRRHAPTFTSTSGRPWRKNNSECQII